MWIDLNIRRKKCKYITSIYYSSTYNGIWISIDIYTYKVSMAFGITMTSPLYTCPPFKLTLRTFGSEWPSEMAMTKSRRFLPVLVVVKEILIASYCRRFSSFFSSKMSHLIKILVIKVVKIISYVINFVFNQITSDWERGGIFGRYWSIFPLISKYLGFKIHLNTIYTIVKCFMTLIEVFCIVVYLYLPS